MQFAWGDVQLGSTTIYFDDVEAGIKIDSVYTVIMQDGFETQYTIPDIPITLPVTHISQIKEDFIKLVSPDKQPHQPTNYIQ